eukprot:4802001-Alexandrium_andersonii.AAC.1
MLLRLGDRLGSGTRAARVVRVLALSAICAVASCKRFAATSCEWAVGLAFATFRPAIVSLADDRLSALRESIDRCWVPHYIS